MENLPPTRHSSRTKSWLGLFRGAFTAFNEDKALRLSAALAYYSLFSIAPLLVISIAMAGMFLGDKAASGEVYGAVKGYVGEQAAASVQSMVESAAKPKTGAMATVLGGVTLLLGAAGILGQLKDALNTIWGVEVVKGAGIGFQVRTKFLNFGMVLVIGLLLLISLILSTSLAALNQNMQHVLALPAWVWSIVASVVSAAVSATLFALLFKFLPDARIRWREVWLGAAITAILFEIGKTALGWYLGRESTANAYGAAGSVVLLILWVYYATCILLYGAEFTQVHATSTGREIEPAAHARLMERAGAATLPQRSPPAITAEATPEEYVPGETPPLQPNPLFAHRLFEPILKYLEGRGVLISIEAKEALVQAAGLLILAAICCVTLFVAWTLLAVALVGLLMHHFDWHWLKAVSVTGGIHVLVTVAAGVLIWRRAAHGAWFAETFNELKKDRIWLRGH
jgi:membrane protein